MKAKATIRLTLKSEKQMTAIVSALKPEINKQIGLRSIVTMTVEARDLLLCVEAKDTISLRATLNTYLRWINSTINVLEALPRES